MGDRSGREASLRLIGAVFGSATGQASAAWASKSLGSGDGQLSRPRRRAVTVAANGWEVHVPGKVCRTLAVAGLLLAGCSDDQDTQSRASGEVPAAGAPELAGIAADSVRSHRVPAVAVSRVSLDSGIQAGVAGTRSHGDDTPVGVDARFHLGSDTKAMTAVLVAQLVETGRLSFDARIADVLPDATVDPSLSQVTIRDVLGHRTGLVDDFDLRAMHDAPDPVAARREVAYEALQSPGATPTEFAYANVNYVLAGVVIETLTSTSWEELMRQRLFDPLGMDTCGFGAPPGGVDPLGHTADGTAILQDAAVTDNPAALGPAGTVHCAIEDWAKFAVATLDLLSGTDTKVLTAETAGDLFGGDHDYVAGWMRSGQDGDVTYGHDGSNTLWYARAVLRPARRDGVLIATNTGEASAVQAIDELTESLLRS